MTKEIGPREKALRAQREAYYAENIAKLREAEKAVSHAEAVNRKAKKAIAVGQELVDRINEAAKKRGKPRKAKKK